MTDLQITPIPTAHAEALWAGGPDFHGAPPERHVSDGDDVPCRHCLREVAAGEPYLVLSFCPFPTPQPFAEVGPIFLHAEPCAAYRTGGELPAMYRGGEARIVRGYGQDDRIIYGTGKVVAPEEITAYAADLLTRPAVAYLHVRSSTNNCFAFRIDRKS